MHPSSANHDSSPAIQRHIPALDGLRGIAVLSVMILHFHLASRIIPDPPERVLLRLEGIGWIGVDLFFVLSGFLITGILHDAKQHTNKLRVYFGNFFARRTLRIFPLYFGYLLAIFVVLPRLFPHVPSLHDTANARWWVWTYLTNVRLALAGWEGISEYARHFWSLAIEEQFYLAWPFLVWVCTQRQMRIACVVAIVAAEAIRLAITVMHVDSLAAYALTPARMDSLALGGLLALTLRTPGGFARIQRLWKPSMLLGVGLLLGVSVWRYTDGMLLPPYDAVVQLVGYPALALLGASAIAAALTLPASAGFVRALSNEKLRFWGRYSYALYVFHVPVAHVLREHASYFKYIPDLFGSEILEQVATLVAGITIALLLAMLSGRYFEEPFQRLKRFFPSGSAVIPPKSLAPLMSPETTV